MDLRWFVLFVHAQDWLALIAVYHTPIVNHWWLALLHNGCCDANIDAVTIHEVSVRTSEDGYEYLFLWGHVPFAVAKV